ncbi:MAG: hypothetical protein P8181_09515 [bacterium]
MSIQPAAAVEEHVVAVTDKVNPKTLFVNSGDIVTWEVDNAAAHSFDTATRFATTVRVTFLAANPTTGPAVNNAPIPPPGGGNALLTVQMLNPLPAGRYPYKIEIIDQFGNVMTEIDPWLVKAGPCPVNCPAMDASGIPDPTADNRSPDLNSDGIVNLSDLAIFAQAWPPGPYNYCCDYNCDGVISLTDLAVFAQHYMHSGPQLGVCN